MIIDDTPLGRFAFIFDINTIKAFQGDKFTPRSEQQEWWPYKLHHLIGDDLIAKVKPMNDWLSEHTKAYRINAATMVLGDFPDMKTALLVQVPEHLAVLFRLYWYEFD